jgi:hypothetical protein
MAKKARKKTRRPSVDCRPIRQRIDDVETKIEKLVADIAEPDLPPAVKKALRQQLVAMRLLLRRLQAALKACEAANR